MLSLLCDEGSFREGVTPKYMHAKGFKRDYYIYGEQFLTDNETARIVNGFDLMTRAGYAPGEASKLWAQLLEEIQAEIRTLEKEIVDMLRDVAG